MCDVRVKLPMIILETNIGPLSGHVHVVGLNVLRFFIDFTVNTVMETYSDLNSFVNHSNVNCAMMSTS